MQYRERDPLFWAGVSDCSDWNFSMVSWLVITHFLFFASSHTSKPYTSSFFKSWRRTSSSSFVFSNLTFDQVFILWTVMLKYLSIVWNFHHFYKLQCYRIWFGGKKSITLFRNTIVLCLVKLPVVKCFKIFQLFIGLVHSVLDNALTKGDLASMSFFSRPAFQPRGHKQHIDHGTLYRLFWI